MEFLGEREPGNGWHCVSLPYGVPAYQAMP